MLPLAFVLFFLSGAFSLVYEITWVRAVTLEFGSTTLAVSTVVSTFMAGLALGAWLAGRRADRMTRPLRTYGLLELALGAYALATPILFRLILRPAGDLAAATSGNFLALSILRFLASALVLLPPTALMGATLPVLSRLYAALRNEGARGAGLLYGINTLGALAGTLAAGFALLPSIGMTWTLVATAALNVTVGAVALLAGRNLQTTPGAPCAPSDPRQPPTILIAVAFTGFAAMVCQVTWTRVLALLLGGSVYAFTAVLAVFLAGLGVGAAATAAFVRGAPARARRAFAVLAMLSALAVWLSSATFPYLPELFHRWFWSWGMDHRFDRVLLAQLAISAAVILLPVLCMGGLFPLAARALAPGTNDTGRGVGAIYAWNTAGCIAGAASAAFLLVPIVGIRGALLVALALQCAGGAVIAVATRPLAASAAIVFTAAALLMPAWDQKLMTSGIYEYAADRPPDQADTVRRWRDTGFKLLFYRDGLTATVTVTEDLLSPDHDLYISTNGKIDGSSHLDMPTQRLCAHLPLLLHPNPRQVCVIGLGTGCTAGSATLHPVERVTVVEIERAIVDGARLFAPHNHDVHSNGRADVRVTDGRLFLRLHPAAFDVVISEPSNPWLAGTSDLFTVDFFRRGAAALREDGLFCQWVQLYGMSPENVRTLVRTFLEVFPHAYLATTLAGTDVLLLGSTRPFVPDLRRAETRFSRVASDLADNRVGIRDIYDFAARFRMGPDELRRYAGQGPLHTDDLPVIAYRAPQDKYRNTRDENERLVSRHARGIGPYLSEEAPFLKALAQAYRRFLPAGREAAECERPAGE
ncbi:MAG: fused MFS/spermidine synthase [Planctomycetes bacterium]|nr:fused MFS/spermidine synthase [Planctomycetota bacterium]